VAAGEDPIITGPQNDTPPNPCRHVKNPNLKGVNGATGDDHQHLDDFRIILQILEASPAFKDELDAAVRDTLPQMRCGRSIHSFGAYFSMLCRLHRAAVKVAGADPLGVEGSADRRREYVDELWRHIDEALTRLSTSP
jgi:hypothetical protein